MFSVTSIQLFLKKKLWKQTNFLKSDEKKGGGKSFQTSPFFNSLKTWQKYWMKSLFFKNFAFTGLQLNSSAPLSLRNLLLLLELSPKKLQVNLCYLQQFVWEISRRHGNQFWCRSDIIEKQFLWLVTYLQVLLLPGVIFTKKVDIKQRNR